MSIYSTHKNILTLTNSRGGHYTVFKLRVLQKSLSATFAPALLGVRAQFQIGTNTAAYPSGLREQSAKLPFSGSNPLAASKKNSYQWSVVSVQ